VGKQIDSEPQVNLAVMIEALKQYLSAKGGVPLARERTRQLGGTVNANPEGGIIIKIDGTTIHVWQPYPDIDYIYYEY